MFALAVLAMMMFVSSGYTADTDPSAVDFKTPSDIKRVGNAAGTNEQALLFGNPSKPGPYVVRLKWPPGNRSRPHFHPNGFFVVVAGAWWMGTGKRFDPEALARRRRRRPRSADPETAMCLFACRRAERGGSR